MVRIAREFVRIWYRDQPKTCRRCGDLGHLINECTSVRCFNCEMSGHRAEACEQPFMCSICLSEEHRERHCPFLFYSTNIDVQPSSESYSNVSRMKSGNPPSSAASVAPAPRVLPAHSTLGYWPSAKKSFVNMQEKARANQVHRGVTGMFGSEGLFCSLLSPRLNFAFRVAGPLFATFCNPVLSSHNIVDVISRDVRLRVLSAPVGTVKSVFGCPLVLPPFISVRFCTHCKYELLSTFSVSVI